MIKSNMEWSGRKRLPLRSALMKIRENGYYQNVLGFETFEVYCKARWDFEKIFQDENGRDQNMGVLLGVRHKL